MVGWALLLGYLVELIHNLNTGLSSPLPRWIGFGEKLRKGGNVLAALIVYNLPLVIPICCYVTTSSFGEIIIVGSAIGYGFLCCGGTAAVGL